MEWFYFVTIYYNNISIFIGAYAIGKIIKINGDYGFINVRGQKDNVYFKVKDALNSNSLGVGNIVEFKVIKTDKGNRALNIRNRGNKNGRNMYK